MKGMISNLNYLPPLSKSDHVRLQFDFNLATPDVNSDYAKFNLNAGDNDTCTSI